MRQRAPEAGPEQASEAPAREDVRTPAGTALMLQRSVGNRAAARLLQRSATVAPYVRFSVKVDRPMDEHDLLVEFAYQSRRAYGEKNLTRARIRREIGEGKVYWVDEDGTKKADGEGPTVSEEEARQGYKLITVYARGVTPLSATTLEERRREFWALDEDEAAEVNRQTNELFWERTGYKVGQQLDMTDEHDRLLAQDWIRFRAEVMEQRKQYLRQSDDVRQMLWDAIPPDARRFVFGGKGVGDPEDYGAALRVALRMGGLSFEERAEFRGRVYGTPTSWEAFEQSLERFIEERQALGEAASSRQAAQAEMEGFEELYFAYTAWLDAPKHTSASGLGSYREYQARTELTRVMADHGFETIEQVRQFLEPRIAAMETAFEQEALLVADKLLAGYRGLLWSEAERLSEDDERRRFYGAVVAAGGNLESLAGRYPLLRDSELRGRLERSPRAVLGWDWIQYARFRRRSIDAAQRELREDNDLLYAFDILMEEALSAAEAGPKSVYRDVVMRRKAQIDMNRLLKGIALAVIAVAASVFTKGGSLALLGAGVAAGIGAWETLEEYQRYEAESRGHEAGLLSDDPSAFWVIVSAMGALGDAAEAARVVSRLSEAARRFDDAHDVARFTEDYDEAARIARAEGDTEAVEALEEARAPILAAAARRADHHEAAELDAEIDDAFTRLEAGPLSHVPVPPRAQAPRAPVQGPLDERPMLMSHVEDEFGMPAFNQAGFARVAKRKQVVIYVRATNPHSVAHLYKGDLMKAEDIKAKTVDEIDLLLGAPESAAGRAAYYLPDLPPRPAGMDDKTWNAVCRRFVQRHDEYWTQAGKMTELTKPIDAQVGTRAEHQVDVADGVIVDVRTGKAFAGDHDVYDIRHLDGSPLSESEYLAVLKELEDEDVVRHGAHMWWKPKTPAEQEIFDQIVERHTIGGEPLLLFAPGVPPRRARPPG